MYGAYERLSPEWKQRIAKLRAVHNLDFSRTRRHGEEPMTEAQRKAVPPVDQPIVLTHPDTGRKCLSWEIIRSTSWAWTTTRAVR